MLKELLLPLLAGVALAQTPADVSESYDAEEAAYAAEREEWRRSEHNALNAILAFVHDRASADAAAPRVRALMASPGGKGLRPSGDVGLFLYFGYQCFGSEALMAELRALVPQDAAQAFERGELIRRTMTPFMDEMMAQLDGISTALAQVKDAETEAAAMAAARAFPAYMQGMAQRCDAALQEALAGREWQQDDAYVTLALRQIYPLPALDRLLHAYARAPHSPALEQAVREAWAAIAVPCGVDFTPAASPGALAQQEALAAALHEWFGVAATITDKASADAAADWMARKSAELGRPLMAIPAYRADELGICLCVIWLAARQEAALSYLECASPAFFGSEKLQGLLREAEEAAMPAPKVIPLKK